ncbi:NINE protein [Synechocystis sp. PCC 7509]|uniref:NINE protein n=1 Tax=Synechocystis sp. PCC 7509 TaxID=927677 RepID=UPI0002AC4ABC|nr:NINE protein [Synechocystis sp. PCC 7509]
MSDRSKSRKIAAVLALTGTISPIAGWHKFYLGQPLWGVVYLLLSWTPIPRAASAIEGLWYLLQNEAEFDDNFNQNGQNYSSKVVTEPNNVKTISEDLRQLDGLREDGLISEYEFEQKRRQMLDKID